MIYSMTGFGKGTASGDGFEVEIKITSLNSRYLDLKFRMPGYFNAIEHKLRSLVSQKLERGKVNLFVNLVPTGPRFKPSRIDLDAAESFYGEIAALRERLGLTSEIDINTLVSIPDVVLTCYSEAELEIIYPVMVEAMEKAIDELQASRAREGEALGDDLRERKEKVLSLTDAIEMLSHENSQAQLRKLKERLRAIIGDAQVDEQRLLLEAGILAERYDTTEELVRLRSHLNNFESDLGQGDSQGKRLSFIVQEMLRETNTIGSKCNDAAISAFVISIKEELEKMREQAANLE